MKRINRFLTRSAVVLTVAAAFSSCSMEAPFGAEGEGNLTLTTDIRGDVTKTRAISTDELAVLREKCVVYIENDKGIVRRYRGLDNVPPQIRLNCGSYVAEAWSGDSVSASFDSKFYRGWQKFEMTEGENSLTLRCNIANVIVSVDPTALDVDLNDLKITFSHSRGELVFDKNNIPDAKGYFMMPNADKDLQYKVQGTKADGSAYEKTGKIENVQRAHEYVMQLTQDASEVTEGGALIRLTILDIPVIEEEVEVFSAPLVRGDGFNIDEQVASVDRNFTDRRVYIRGYFGLSSVNMKFSDNYPDLAASHNILENSVITDLASKGIIVERRTSKDAAPSLDGGEVTVDELYVTFTKAFLDALPASNTEYAVTFDAVDGRHNEGGGKLRIANSQDALEVLAPIGTVSAASNSDLMAIGARRATLQGALYDAASTGFGIQYRKQGDSEWISAYPTSSGSSAARRQARSLRSRGLVARAEATRYSVNISGLQPGTVYEYRAFCEGYDQANVETFTTESIYSIVNASFEDWSTYEAQTLLGKKVVTLPGSTGDKMTSFWCSGNEGSMTANQTITDKSTDMVHSGTYSARLGSKNIMSKLAAGNIFIGYYVKTDGTDGVLSLGREYNGSHPSKLRVYANYRPSAVDKMTSGNESFVDFNSGDLDHGQIYVALTDATVDIRTKASERKLFDPNDSHVLAYGQVTWKEAFGPDGALQAVEIPLEYKEAAHSVKPTHIVIVASASKFGDYFCGGSSSVMYLDDFELIYE